MTVDIPRSIDLNPEDWLWVTYRPRSPLPRPEPKPFDREEASKRLEAVILGKPTYHWRWSDAKISAAISYEESLFWLKMMICATKASKGGIYDPIVASIQLCEAIEDTFDSEYSSVDISPDFIVGILPTLSISACPDELVLPLTNLFTLPTFISIVSDDRIFQPLPREIDWRNIVSLASGFRKYILPYLSHEEIQALHPLLRAKLNPSQWSQFPQVRNQLGLFLLGSYLGMHSEIQALIETWPDGFCQRDCYWVTQDIILGLGDPKLVAYHMRRLKGRLSHPQHIRGWMAHTGYIALDYLRDSAFNEISNSQGIVQGFNLVKAPEAAPYVLELMLAFKAPGMARQWLRNNPEQAIAGLIPTAAGTGKLAEAAQAFLRSMKRKGYKDLIEACVMQESELLATKLRATVLDIEEIPLDEKTTPVWLQQSLSTVLPKKTSKLPSWLEITELSPLQVGQYCLNREQTEAVLMALKQSTLAAPHPLIATLKTHLTPSTLETFAWSLFENWIYEDTSPAKENWMLIAVGLLGQDTSVFKLAPFIRLWPGASHHKRAVLGLECLRSIGTDTALMQIYSISQTVKFKGLKAKAQECMEAIAQSRNLTRDQLEDRIVPDCGLDKRGSRVFNYGSRQFQVVLGTELQPLVRDDKGALKPNLPKPTAKDDAEKATRAIADWKLLKKQTQDVTKTQSDRLKRAMLERRFWDPEEFSKFLVQHPLTAHLVKRLIWAGYNERRQMVVSFRVTEDSTYADAEDKSVILPETNCISVLHPAQLSAEQRAAWGELLSDYEIFQPFRQLNRTVHSLEPDEIGQKVMTRFQNTTVNEMIAPAILKKANWTRFTNEARLCYGYSKLFPSVGISAILEYLPRFQDIKLDRCYFFPTPFPETPLDIEQALSLETIDPVIISEVLRTLKAIVTASQERQ
jgi:hypothetical protein